MNLNMSSTAVHPHLPGKAADVRPSRLPNLLRTFTIFNEFPKELRLMIWEAALPGPRIVFLEREELPLHQTSRV
jgi:hypothetical protein